MNIQNQENFEHVEFDGIQDVKDIKSKTFLNCSFKDCDFTESDFSLSRFSDCRFHNCNLSLIVVSETKLQDVCFDSCKIMGVDFTLINKLIFKIDFQESQIIKCSFSELDMSESDFQNCIIQQSDFYQSKLVKSNFTGSDLQDTIFDNSDLTEADFTDAKNYAINPLNNKIKNAQFSMPDAIQLLNALNIKIYL